MQCVRYLFEGLFEFSILDKFIGLAKLFTVIPIDALEPNPLGVGGIWFLIGLFCFWKKFHCNIRCPFGNVPFCTDTRSQSITHSPQ